MASETCSTSSSDVERFRGYGVPDDVKVVLPSSNQTIFDKPPGMVSVYLEFFDKCGLRFPLTPFFGACLIYYGVSISQLTPNSVKCMVGFEVLCRVADVRPSVSLFSYFFRPFKWSFHWYGMRVRPTPIPKLILSLPECSNWKRKFVFVGEKMFPKRMSWKETNNHYLEPDLKGKMLDDMHKLSAFSLNWSILLSEKMLHSAKMPNVYSGPLPVMFRDKNGNEVSMSAVDFLRENSKPGGLPEESPSVDDCEEQECVGKDGKLRKTLGADATPSKRAKLSGKSVLDGTGGDVQVDKRMEEVEVALAAIEQVKSRYKDSDNELAAVRKGLEAEVEKNLALKGDLEKAKTELEAARQEVSGHKNLTENYRLALKKNMVLEEALDKAKRELEAYRKEATKSRQGLEKTSALEEALAKAKKDVEAYRTEASNYGQGLDAEVKKNVGLNEDLQKAKKELEEARKETSSYGQRYREKLVVNVALERSLEKAKRELEAEKKRSAMAQEEANKAKKSATAAREEADNVRKSAQQEVSTLHSGIRDLYLRCNFRFPLGF